MTRIVAIGECMVELAPTGPTAEYRMGFAGDTLNTSWYLRQLLGPEDQVDYFTALGADTLSDQMMYFLTQSSIGTDHIIRRGDLTVGLYMIQLAEGERSFNYWRGQSAARTLAQDAATLTQAMIGADIAYFSGITLAILPPQDRERLLDVLRQFRTNGGSVVFDPNLRRRLWDSAGEMTSAVMAAGAVSDIVLPSHEDEKSWFGDTSPNATAQRYAEQGADIVVVKNGPGQIVTITNGELSMHTPVNVADIVDTTAAGDSFNAGFIASRMQGHNLAEAITAASTLAAQVIQFRGALIQLPSS
ncbi:sugar kinase [Shimia sagamensis]|uniref:2-keto-3-deoxygluconate kinase n=1 Tax=Shimia sagamensis TaxID=1566352 RepID=A0ABY1NZ98_9RHOB|nr:sugar kinase [Shimia sagamensis]SMP21356.1 2-keto-3-deoxygluconate kinase [Shimia sagamensis]